MVTPIYLKLTEILAVTVTVTVSTIIKMSLSKLNLFLEFIFIQILSEIGRQRKFKRFKILNGQNFSCPAEPRVGQKCH